MLLKKKRIILSIIMLIFIQNAFSQSKKNKILKKQPDIVLVVDNVIEIWEQNRVAKKKFITLTLSNANSKPEYKFLLEIDNERLEYILYNNTQSSFTYDNSFKIVSDEIKKYKIIDKKKLLY